MSRLLHGGRGLWRYQRPPWRPAGSSCGARCAGYNFATVAKLDRKGHDPATGHQVGDFTVKRVKEVPELQLTGYQLHHEGTGAEYVHIARNDKNNVFSIGFKTNPPDHTGVPHILEHTTLCGSKKYPVRDPFFKMLRRSLANFMNAFTSSDHTMYPFATTNPQDFRNLLSVYMDATLHPLLKENDFKQEGWRIGPDIPQSSNQASESSEASSPDSGRPVFKGVVYNEMKGQMSDASYLFYTRFQDHIFPSINNSAGDPSRMTDLSYSNLTTFHQDHYHPSNTRIFTYGNIPLADHAEQISTILKSFSSKRIDTTVKLPESLQAGPLEYCVQGPVDSMLSPDTQCRTSITWALGDTSDIVESFSLGVISSLLLQGYGAPLYQALIESGLGTDYSANTGYDGSAKIGLFSIGLNGVREADVPKVKTALQAKLREVHDQGFDDRKIDGILHQLEIALKHKNAEFGLDLMQRLQSGWFNGIDPLDSLAWNDTVAAFKRRLAQGGYLEGLLNKYFLNDKTLTFTMKPSSTFETDTKKEEERRLEAKVVEANRKYGSESAALENYKKQELKLLEEQAKAPDQDLSSLPTLHVQDIPREQEVISVRQSSLGAVQVQWRESETNGLTYVRGIHQLQNLPQDMRMLIPLFSSAVRRLGTQSKSVEEIEDLIKLKTGGISLGYHCSSLPSNFRDSVEGIAFSANALDEDVENMFEILRMLIQDINFDDPSAAAQIMQLLQADASGALDVVAGSGHSYARRYAEAGLTKRGLFDEQVGGLTQIQHIVDLAQIGAERGLADIISKLKTIQSLIISNTASLRIAVTCGKGSATSNEAHLSKFLRQLPDKVSMPSEPSQLEAQSYKVYFPLPYQVSYGGAALPTVSYTDTTGASLQILSQLLTHKHLHHELREKGGAYGGGSYARGLSGLFGFYSYRDPNPRNSFQIIQDAGRWARDKQFTDQDLEEAKLSTFQGVDAPQSVNEEGMAQFLYGIDQNMEQVKRQQLLDVTRSDVRDVAQKYLVDQARDMHLVLLGPQQDWLTPSQGWDQRQLSLGDSDSAEAVPESDLAASRA